MFNIEALAVPGLIVFFLLSIFYTLQRSYFKLLGLLFISFGMNAFTALAGTLWFPHKVVMIPIVVFIFFNTNWYSKVYIISPYFLLLFLSVMIGWVSMPNTSGTTFLQGPMMRPVVQLYTYLSMGIMTVFIVYIIRTNDMLKYTLKIYFRLSEIIIIIGLIHLIFIILGLEFIPILRPGGNHSQMAAFGYEDTVVNRIYGISGEPKTLATFVIPYIFISGYNYLEKNFNVNPIYHLSFIIISTLVFIYTFSSALLTSAAIALPVISFLFRHKISKQVFRFSIVISIVAFAFFKVGDSFIKDQTSYEEFALEDEKKEIALSEILYERSFGRIEAESDERFERLAIDYMFSKTPYFLITGYGLGMYNYHLPLPKHGRGVEPIDSGWVVILMDLGILGLFFFIYLLNNVIKIKRHNHALKSIYIDSFIIGTIVGFIAHIGNNALYIIFMFLGLTIAAYSVALNENNKNKPILN